MENIDLQSLFFELIQVALGKKNKLSSNPSNEEWEEIYLLCQKQAIIGIALPALDTLSKREQKIPLELLYDWIGMSELIRQRNVLLNDRCREIQLLLSKNGINSSILKGQGISMYYNETLQQLRQSGDIDVFVNCGREKAIKLVRNLGEHDLEWDYVHVKLFMMEDVEIELHYRVECLSNLICNHQLQAWFKRNKCLMYENCGNLIIPSLQFNLFYLLLHIYRHFLHEGVGLRQLMDYYFVLVKANGNFGQYANGESIRDILGSVGMLKFSSGIMWVLNKVFLLDEKLMICQPSEIEGNFILKIIMCGGDFGHFDERINKYYGKFGIKRKELKHKLHIFSHYPSELFWSPIWIVYHKCWKLTRKFKG